MLHNVDTIALAIVRATYRALSADASAKQGKHLAKLKRSTRQQRDKKGLWAISWFTWGLIKKPSDVVVDQVHYIHRAWPCNQRLKN
jgi:predicted neuraminidase